MSVFIVHSGTVNDGTLAHEKRRIRRHSHGRLVQTPARIHTSSTSRFSDRLLSSLKLIESLLSVPFLTIAWNGKGWKLRRRSRVSVSSRCSVLRPTREVSLSFVEAIGHRCVVSACLRVLVVRNSVSLD